MHAIEKFQKHNNSPWFKKFKSNTQYKSFFDKNKYFFNEMYKIKAIPTEDLVFVITRILKHKIEEPTKIDLQIKKIARGFVEDHHELFPENIEDNTEDLEHAYEGDTPKYIINSNNKNMSENDVKNSVKNDVEKHDEKSISNAASAKPGVNPTKDVDPTETIEKTEEIKQDVEKIEELQAATPNFKHIEEFHNKIEELKEDIHKKFNDMIDAHMDLKKSIEEKRNISNHDAKSRIENMEGKIEMLYGKQMEESTKQKKTTLTKPKTKEDMLQHYINKKLNK